MNMGDFDFDFREALGNYSNDLYIWECIEFHDGIEILYQKFKALGYELTQRDIVSFWTWFSSQLDASFLSEHCFPVDDEMRARISEFTKKYKD